MEKYCICVDWLEVCAYGNLLREGEVWVQGKCYLIRKEERQTAMFKDFFIITFRGLEYAYIRQTPRLERMKKGLTCVKLANRVLYHEAYVPFLQSLMRALNLRYHGITRMDIALDCNKFPCGRSPHRFIRDFVMKPIGEIGGMYLAGCREYSIHGRKSISNDGQINYIQFGSPSGDRKGYIYDKSLELQEVKDKPWIREMWEAAGLKNDDKNHVWRAEISIKGGGKDLLNLETGQLFPLAPEYIACYENVKKVFHFFAAKVFDFRINTGQKNRRNYSRLNLFDKAVGVTCLPKRVSNRCDSGRSEKVCANKLKELSRTYVDMTESVRHSLYAAIEWIQNLGSIKAARYKEEQCKYYLDVFASTRFLQEEDFAYLQACAECAEAKRQSYDEAEYFYRRYLMAKQAKGLYEEDEICSLS